MVEVGLQDLLAAGAHYGHLTRRWNPKMKPFIFMEKNGIHIIDLNKTKRLLAIASDEMEKIAAEGKKVLFVGTKQQAKDIVKREALRCGMHWISERWLGGMLTNFTTIRKSIKRLQNIEKMMNDGTFDRMIKKERLILTREKEKLEKVFEGIRDLTRLPGALFIVDIKKEHIAVKEANRLGIPVFAIVDTNCDPEGVDYIIPANDDSVRTIDLIVRLMADKIIEGQQRAKELQAEMEAEEDKESKTSENN
ncbi:MAG: 30S ribosomal protein S2 [Ignavibacteria bacterium]